MIIGQNIKRFRKKRSLEKDYVASKSKIDIELLEQIEAGQRSPNLKTLYNISAALEVSVFDILGYKNQEEV